jgi:hypothetical protein
MRLLDEDSNKKLDRVTLYLTRSEAEELRDDLERILANPRGNHAHLSSKDFRKEITICIYDDTMLNDFNERSKKLIKEDL